MPGGEELDEIGGEVGMILEQGPTVGRIAPIRSFKKGGQHLMEPLLALAHALGINGHR